ncbi:hypothetical protein GCM10009551_099840 [Nocardiopsis tropica]|uniref:hypothetical protein n=1 Tax=Tsukamurella strandjordii TaxID=147577 RepID=UPI0031DC1C95
MRTSRILTSTALAAAAVLAIAGCGTDNGGQGGQHAGHGSATSASSDHAGMPGMGADSLSATRNGYTLAAKDPGQSGGISFTITGPDGKPVTDVVDEQTEPMHLYLVRDDLTGFQHVHPTASGDGSWTAPVAAPLPGSYRVYVQVIPRAAEKDGPIILSNPVAVAGIGKDAKAPLPPAAASATAGEFGVTVSGTPAVGTESRLSIAISRNGSPETALQPYLQSFAHVTAIHEGDLALSHLHPVGGPATGTGGPTVEVDAMFGASGNYRMFVQFQVDGQVRTVPITVAVP